MGNSVKIGSIGSIGDIKGAFSFRGDVVQGDNMCNGVKEVVKKTEKDFVFTDNGNGTWNVIAVDGSMSIGAIEGNLDVIKKMVGIK